MNTIKLKTILTFALLVFVMASTWATDKEKAIKSKVKSVTVFLNRAQVTNAARAYIPAGQTILIFEGLSTRLDKQSLQVSAEGNLTIMAVKHRINYLKSFSKVKRIKQLEDSIAYFEDRIDNIKVQKDVLISEEQMILANQKIAGKEQGLSAQKLAEMAAFYRKRLSDIRFSVLRHKKSLKKHHKRLEKLRTQLYTENKNANKPTSEVMVTVSAKAPVNATFELNYIVMNAGWIPIYDLRAKNSKSPIQLSYKAEIFQNTGIDWNNVDITLSTGNPSQSGYKPTLNPWYVGFMRYYPQPKPRREQRSPNVTLDEVLVSGKTNSSFTKKDKNKTIADFTKVIESTFATKFDISLPYSIPSNGRPQLVEIAKHNMKTLYTHNAVPKLDKDAFLMAQLVEWEKFNLLSGKANIYFEGTFVGETFLNAKNTSDTLNISLGRDKRIIIERKQIKDFTRKKFLGSNIKQTFGYDISVRNTKRENVTITIEEQIPVSKTNKITVELLEAEGAQVDKITGKVTWKITLKPQQTTKLTLKYSVKYPKKQQIVFGR